MVGRESTAGERETYGGLRICLPVSVSIVSRSGHSTALQLGLDQVHHPGELLPTRLTVLRPQSRHQPALQLGLAEVPGHDGQHRHRQQGDEGEDGETQHLNEMNDKTLILCRRVPRREASERFASFL